MEDATLKSDRRALKKGRRRQVVKGGTLGAVGARLQVSRGNLRRAKGISV